MKYAIIKRKNKIRNFFNIIQYMNKQILYFKRGLNNE